MSGTEQDAMNATGLNGEIYLSLAEGTVLPVPRAQRDLAIGAPGALPGGLELVRLQPWPIGDRLATLQAIPEPSTSALTNLAMVVVASAMARRQRVQR